MVQKRRHVSVEDELAADIPGKLFVDEHDSPVAFFLHKSIKSQFQRNNLILGIEENGGIVRDDDEDVDTVLVDKDVINMSSLQLAYSLGDNRSKAKIYVEHMTFVSRCIKNQQFRHVQPARTGMGGPARYTKGRTNYTKEDELKMCQAYARKIPDKEAGGRLSLAFWEDTCRLINSPGFEWTARHPPQSWLEHYKKNQERLDDRINDILEEEGRPPVKNLWPRDRRLNRRGNKRTRRDKMSSESEEFSGSSTSEEDEDDDEVDILEDREEIEKISRAAAQKPSKTMSKEQREGVLTDEEPDLDNFDNMDRYDYEEDFNQAGPSGTLQPPSPTLVEPHANHSVTDAPNNTQGSLSQRTLVATNSVPGIPIVQKAAPRKVASQPSVTGSSPSRQTNAEQHDNTEALPSQAPFEPAGISHNRAIPSNQGQVTAIPIDAPKDVPQHPSSPVIGSTLSEWTSPPKTRTVSKRAKPLSIQPQSPVEAPYRNTRSRSRSVEPSQPPPAKKARRAKKATAATNSARLPPLEEAEIEDPVDPKGPAGASISAGTAVEEMVVEDLLMVEPIHPSNASGSLGQTPARQSSLETDDAQTRKTLRGSRVKLATLPSRYTPGKRPGDMLRAFIAAESTRSHNHLALGLRPRAPPAESVRPRNLEPFPLASTGSSTLSPSTLETARVFTTPQHKTPTVTSHKRRLSISSVESFPVAGTRASAVKKSAVQKEKQTPYKPPTMTRAARFVKPQ